MYIYIYTHIYRQIERDNEISSLEYTHCNIHIHIINILYIYIYIYIYIFAFVHQKPELVKLGKPFHDAAWVSQRQLWMCFMQLSHQLVCSFKGKCGCRKIFFVLAPCGQDLLPVNQIPYYLIGQNYGIPTSSNLDYIYIFNHTCTATWL